MENKCFIHIGAEKCGSTSIQKSLEINQEIDILKIAGVVQVGLFNKMCDVVVLAKKSGVETIVNPNGRIIN